MATIFETQPCGRCGGSGHYSYNQINGTRCFGCDGAGVALTARAKKARAWLQDQCKVRAADIKPGMTVTEYGKFLVHEVIADTKSTAKSLRDGVWVDAPPYLTIKPRPDSKASAMMVFPDTMVKILPAKDDLKRLQDEALKLQNSLPAPKKRG